MIFKLRMFILILILLLGFGNCMEKSEENIEKVVKNTHKNILISQHFPNYITEKILHFLNVSEILNKYRLISTETNKKYEKISVLFKKEEDKFKKLIPFQEFTDDPNQFLIFIPKFIRTIQSLSFFQPSEPERFVEYENGKLLLEKRFKNKYFEKFLSQKYFEQEYLTLLLFQYINRINKKGSLRLQQVFENFRPDTLKYYSRAQMKGRWAKNGTTTEFLISNNIIFQSSSFHFLETGAKIFFDGEIFPLKNEQDGWLCIFLKMQKKLIFMHFDELFRTHVRWWELKILCDDTNSAEVNFEKIKNGKLEVNPAKLNKIMGGNFVDYDWTEYDAYTNTGWSEGVKDIIYLFID